MPFPLNIPSSSQFPAAVDDFPSTIHPSRSATAAVRKLLEIHWSDGPAFPPLPSNACSYAPPLPPPPPPPFIFFFSSNFSLPRTIFDYVTIVLIAAFLILSLLAFSFIFYLRLRSLHLHHLQNFNSLWTVRLLLVTLASLWGLNEIWRLPSVRRDYILPHLPHLTIQQQANICQIHVVLSLGLFEPGFLITLLFLVNVSIKKTSPSRMWALVSLLLICVPTTLLQIICVFFSPLEGEMPKFIQGSSFGAEMDGDEGSSTTVLCAYPLLSCVLFGGFMVAYAAVFLVSCWRVVTLVINKRIRSRVNALATSVMVGVAMQVLCLSMSSMWMPEDAAYGCVVLAMFIFVAANMAVGEFIVVLRPIADALAVDANLRLEKQPPPPPPPPPPPGKDDSTALQSQGVSS